MPDFIKVASTEEIPPGERIVVEVEDDVWVAVFNVSGTFHAIEDICPHDGGPLGDGPIEGHVVECPRHGARFDVRNGEVVRLPSSRPVPAFATKVEGDEVYVSTQPVDA